MSRCLRVGVMNVHLESVGDRFSFFFTSFEVSREMCGFVGRVLTPAFPWGFPGLEPHLLSFSN